MSQHYCLCISIGGETQEALKGFFYVNHEPGNICPYSEAFRKGRCRGWLGKQDFCSVNKCFSACFHPKHKRQRWQECWNIEKWCYKYFGGGGEVLEMTVLGFMLVDINLERTVLLQYFKWALMLILPPPLFSEPSFLTMCSHRNIAMSNLVSWKTSKQNLCQNVNFAQHFLLSHLSVTRSCTFLFILIFYFPFLNLKKNCNWRK